MSYDQLVDSFGRRINYLRVSLTDLCNFRCLYCLPPEGLPVLPQCQLLTQTEIVRLITIIGRIGVNQIRLTGGEPLLRQDIVEIVRGLKKIETVKDLSITTNGSRLKSKVGSLKEAGLDRINISLDSLSPERFREITRSDSYQQVMEATFAALQAGFPVKLNMVAIKGLTAEEIIRFVKLARDYPLEVRFLEFMPLCGQAWGQDLFLPIAYIRSIVKEHFELEQEMPRGDRVAETFYIRDGKGKVGFIASLTESFCDRCSRMRLSSDGKLFPCLFSDAQVSVRELLRENAPEEAIIEAIRKAARIKPRGNWFQDHPYREGHEDEFELKPSPMIHNLGG